MYQEYSSIREGEDDSFPEQEEELTTFDWSLDANESDEFQRAGPAEVNLSDIKTVVRFSRQQTVADRLVWIFGLLGVASMAVASIWAYQNKGGSSSSNSSIRTPVSAPKATPNGETIAGVLWPGASPTQEPFDWNGIPSNDNASIVANSFEVSLVPQTFATSIPTQKPVTIQVTSPLATSEPSPVPTSNPTIRPSPSPTLSTASPTEQVTQAPTSPPPTTPPTTVTNAPTEQPTQSPLPPPTISPTFAVKATTASPTVAPISPPSQTQGDTETVSEPTYIPGKLTKQKFGLLLSEGLNAALIATTDQQVLYADGTWSSDLFHSLPDAGATFPDTRPENPGGWIYVSNSEVKNKRGGVGAFTFDKDGNVLDFRPVLKGTSMNCGGGRTPWNTWVTCEEVEFNGQVYQVDPTGAKEPQLMTLGQEGGRWEAFAYDVRNKDKPRFFVTEDHRKGALRRFTPDKADWEDPWSILHADGITVYLMLFPNATMDGGKYHWTDNLEAAKENAKLYYPDTEGIDVYENELFFVCKKIKMLFTLDLDGDTYHNHTTRSGLFAGQPDQMQRILNDSRDLIYFTEEGGADAGIHARDHLGRFYTIFESIEYPDETTGLAFSPDGRFMYTAYQKSGLLFCVWREDGHPFQASHLDIKYHHQS